MILKIVCPNVELEKDGWAEIISGQVYGVSACNSLQGWHCTLWPWLLPNSRWPT